MAVLNFTGFEIGITPPITSRDEWSTVGTTFASIQSTTKRTGNYAFKYTGGGSSGTGWVELAGISASSAAKTTYSVATVYIRFYLNVGTVPTNNPVRIINSIRSLGGSKLAVRLTTSGKLEVLDSTGASIGTGNTVLNTGQWYRIEVKVGTGSSAAYELRIDGVTELSGTADLNTNNNVSVEIGNRTSVTSNAVYYIDDVLTRDDDWPGEGAVVCLKPNGDGTYTAWTGDYTAVDDLVAGAGDDGDTTYVSTTTNGDRESVTLDDLGEDVGPISGVKAVFILRNTSGTNNNRVFVRSGSTDSENSSNFSPGTSYEIRQRLLTTDPNTGSAWTKSGVNAAEVGHRRVDGSNETRSTMMALMVAYAPPPPAQDIDMPAISVGSSVAVPSVQYVVALPHRASEAALYAPTAAYQVSMPAIASGSIVYQPSSVLVEQELELPAIGGTASVVVPSVQYVVAVPHRASEAVLYEPTLAYEMSMPAIASGSVVYQPSLVVSQELELPAIGSTASVAVPSVQYVVAVPHRASEAVLYEPRVVYQVSMPAITSGSIVYQPSVAVEDQLELPAIGSTATLYSPAVSYGITGATISGGSATYAPRLAYVIALPTIGSNVVLYVGTVANKFVSGTNKALVLCRIFLDTGPVNVSDRNVIHPSWVYEGRVLSFGSVDRSVATPSGMPQVDDARIKVADTDRKLRNLLATQTPRRRIIELKVVQGVGGSESSSAPFFVGEIVEFQFSAGACELAARDRTFAWLDEAIPSLINRTNFPNLPEGIDEAFAPIIFGRVVSREDNPQGVISLPHMGFSSDIGDRWCVASHPVWDVVAVYRKKPGEGAFSIVDPDEFEITGEAITIDGIDHEFNFTFLDFLEEQESGTEIRADVEGAHFRGEWNGFPAVGYDEVDNPDGEPGPLRNPIDSFINATFALAVLTKAGPPEGFDAGRIMGIREKFQSMFVDSAASTGTAPYLCDGAIVNSLTARELLGQFLTSFALDLFQTKLGKVALNFTDETDPDRPVFTEGRLILRNSFKEGFANPTKNRSRYRYELNYATKEWASQEIFDNVDDQLALGEDMESVGRVPKIEEEQFDMYFVRDPRTALDVVLRRMSFLALGSYRQEFQLPLPEVVDDVELCRLVGITHLDGLDEDTGYVNKEVKVTGITIDIDKLAMTVRSILRIPQTIQIPPVLMEGQLDGESDLFADGCQDVDPGETWTRQTTPTTNMSWADVVWSESLQLYVAVGSRIGSNPTKVMYSPDGFSWTVADAPQTSDGEEISWKGLAWSEPLGLFVAVGSSPSIDTTRENVMTSPDGINWTLGLGADVGEPNPDGSTPWVSWSKVIWSDELGLFVAVGANLGVSQLKLVMTSPDGFEWTAHDAVGNGTVQWSSVCWSPSPSLLVAVASVDFASPFNRLVMTSPDGSNWTLRTPAAVMNWNEVVWSEALQLFIAVAGGSAGVDKIMTSPDGSAWTQQTVPSGQWFSIVWIAEFSRIVVLGRNPSLRATVLISTDGINWSDTDISSPGAGGFSIWSSMAWSASLGRIVAVSTAASGSGFVMTSDGVDCGSGGSSS